MTVDQWLARRTPEAPDALAARIRAILGDRLFADASTAREACMAAAEEQLARILAGQNTGRASAVDLLAADALITYALEHAAESAESVEAWAGDAMTRIAGIGTRHAAGAP